MKKWLLILFFPVSLWAQKPQLVIKSGLQSEVIMAAISPDNALGLTVENSEVLILWELRSGRQLRSFQGIMAGDFSADGKSLEVVTKDYGFRTLDFNGTVLKEGSRSKGGNDKNNRLTWSYYRGKGILLENGSVYTRDKGFIGRVLLNKNYGTEQAYSEVLDLVAIPSAHEVRLCKVPSAEIVKVLSFQLSQVGGNDPIRFTQFSPDGRYLLAGNNHSIDVQDIASGKSVFTFGYTSAETDSFLNNAGFSANNSQLLLFGSKEALLVDLSTGKPIWRKPQTAFRFNQYSSRRGIARMSDDGTVALLGDDKILHFISAGNGNLISSISGFSQMVVDNQQLVEGAGNLFIHQGTKLIDWNLRSGAVQKTIPVAGIDKLLVNSNGGQAYGVENEVNLKTAGLKPFALPARPENINDIGLSFDGKLFLHTARYEDRSLNNPFGINHDKLLVFDVATKKMLWRRATVNAAAFAHTSSTIAAINSYNAFDTITLLNGLTGKALRVLRLSEKLQGAFKPFFSPRDKYLSFATASSQAIIETTTGRLININKNLPNGKYILTACFLPDESTLVASDYDGELFFYDLARQTWTDRRIKASPNGVTSLSVTQNNRYLFTNGDGSAVKLWDLQTNELLATLYPDPATGNWAAVTPNGQFDASAPAQKDIYFVKGVQPFPLESLYEKYFTPSLLPRLLSGERFGQVSLDNLYKAPVVKLNYEQKARNLEVGNDLPTYQNTTGVAEIVVTAMALEDKVDEIRLFHNGKIVTLGTRNLVVADAGDATTLVRKYTLSLLPGQNNIRAIALNSQRTESNPDEMAVIYKNSTSQVPAPTTAKVVTTTIAPVEKTATLHLVVVGINAYNNPAMSLNYALADATAFREEVERDARSVTANVKTYFVSDKNADKNGIMQAFKQVQENAKLQDVFVFYYAGHGVVGNDNEFYLVPSDVSDLKNVQQELVEKAIPSKLLQQYAIDIPAQKQLFILDACQSAGAFENLLADNGNQQKNIAVVARSTGTHWIAASGSKQFANEFSQLGHGAFTYVLLDALKGKALENGMITVNGLKNFLQAGVPELMKKYSGAAQYPASYGFGADFPVQIEK